MNVASLGLCKEPWKYKHGRTGTKEFNAWCNMRYRCYKKDHPTYHLYGGRGITVCDEWRDSFEQFFKDMGKAPSHRYSLERIDNDKGYSPENCAWADKKTQGNNTRRNIYIEYGNRVTTLANWSRILGIKYMTLYARIARGWSVEEAFKCK